MEEIIHIERMSKTYEARSQRVAALREVSLRVEANEFVAIMGPSGSGKSTLMNILGCLDTPTEGRYVLSGTDVSRMDDRSLAEVRSRKIGFIFQSFNLQARYNALENMALPLIYRGMPKNRRLDKAREALRSVGLEERMMHLPAEMSGG